MDWLEHILEGVAEAEEITAKIRTELPKNFIPKDKYNQLAEEKKALLQNQKADSDKAVKEAVIQYALASLGDNTGARDAELIKVLLDQEAIHVDDEGKVDGLSQQLAAIRQEKPYLFGDELLNGRTPVAGDGAPLGISKEQFQKMGYRERLELYNDNPELYEHLNQQNE